MLPRWLPPAPRPASRPALRLENLEIRCVPATLAGVDSHDLCDSLLPVHSETDPVGSTDTSATLGALVDPSQTFFLNSNPGASKVIYLDFDGHTTSGTSWNSSFTGGADFFTPAFDADGNKAAFSTAELERIQYIWQRVAEDFAPFDVNVTTQEPPLQNLVKSGSGDTQWGVRIVIGGNGSWYSSAGGVAYVGSFNWNSDTPAFVFTDNLAGGHEKYTAEAITHETGHTLGLTHDGASGTSYYTGHGSGATGWAPIMGVGYYQDVTQWSKGESLGATQLQDDLAIITSQNGFGYRVDDHGSTRTSATSLNVTGTSVSGSGIIERSSDADWFSFTTGTGTVTLNVTPAARGANLDILAEIYDSSGNMIATSNPTDSLSATFTMSLPAGQYFVRIDGIGTGDPSTGYSDYGSLGQYSLAGTIVDGGTGTTPFVSVDDVTAGESEGTVQFRVSLSAPASDTVTVGFTTADQSAAAGSDYAFTSGTLTFNPGEQVKYVTVNLLNDTVSESTETFALNVTSVSGPAAVGDGQGQATITDDDLPPSPPPPPPPPAEVQVSVNDVTNNEGNVQKRTGAPAQTAFNFTITLSAPSSTPVTVVYSTTDGSAATADVDYLGVSGTVTFAPGETSKTVTVIVLGDTLIEGNETFLLSLTSISGGTLADSTGVGTIRDDDTKGGGKPRRTGLPEGAAELYIFEEVAASTSAETQPATRGTEAVFTRVSLPPQALGANDQAVFLRVEA